MSALSSFIQQRLRSYPHIVGIDEVGRGPLCGPVVSSCAYLKTPLPVKDSKQLSSQQRRQLFDQIKKCGMYSIGSASAEEIDRINILQATIRSFERAITAFKKRYTLPWDKTLFVIDGRSVAISLPIQYVCIEKADECVMQVGAASIVAKVTRDYLTELTHLLYPEYGFNVHRGYGTKAHIGMLKRRGSIPLHRKSFIAL